jgi:hypothetical protein
MPMPFIARRFDHKASQQLYGLSFSMTDDKDSCWNSTFADNGIKMRGENHSASSLSRTTACSVLHWQLRTIGF